MSWLDRLWHARRPPRLAWVLLGLHGVLLLLPVVGFSALRLYESALIRQTESELTAQGVVIAAAFRALGEPAAPPPVEARRWQPLPPRLDLSRDPVLPPLDDPAPTDATPDAPAQRTGLRLMPVLRESQHHTLAAIRVTDARGVVVAATNADWLGLSLAGHAEVRAALDGEPSASLRARLAPEPAPLASISRTARLRVVVAVPIQSGAGVLGAVELLRTPADIWQVLLAKRSALAVAAALLLLALAVVTGLMLRLILKPLHALQNSARRAADGAAFAPPALRGLAEFASLADSVARMAEALEARAAYIRNFAAHVSHEFKTPLTSILASAELLREHPALPPERQARLLALVEAEAKRLHQLTQKLMELAQAETAAPGGNSDAMAVIGSVLQRHRERGQAVVATVLPDRTSPVAVPAECLDLALATLLDNAVTHGGVGASVRLSAAVCGAALHITIEDDGPGLSDANAARLFTPFFTTGRAQGCTGLGLCIARAQLCAHGGDLTLASAKPARFVIECPLAARP